MRDQADLFHRAAEIKQALLLALKQANTAALDGSRDQDDLDTLARALDLTRAARDHLEVLHKRLHFFVELGRLSDSSSKDDGSRTLISLVRLGVDGGFDVAEVKRMIDQSAGRA